MFEELKNTEMHYRDIEASLSNPEIAGDPQKSTKLLKEYKELTPVVTAYRDYLDTLKTVEESLELLAGADEEMHELASEELKSARAKQEELEKKITLLLLPHDPNDEKNVIIEIRAGAGGEEAALFVSDLYRMYSMYSMGAGYKISIISDTPTELGGHRQLAFTVEGEGAYSRFKFESGVHRVQRVPETEAQGRIQTSTVTVAVLPEVEEVNIEIKPEDIFYESCKSSGAGGQHINKTESAVRLTHKPTGIVVWCQEERSQFKNKDKALQMLRTILYNRAQEAQDTEISESRKKQVGTGDRSEKIRTYNYPQSRVTDHRIGMSIYTLDKFMNGDIGSMIDALATAETAQKLAERQS